MSLQFFTAYKILYRRYYHLSSHLDMFVSILSPLLYYSVQDVVVAAEVEDFSVAGRQHLLLQGESQQPQPLLLKGLSLLLVRRRNLLPNNKAGECSRELVLPLPRVWRSERDPQLPIVQLALLPTHLVEMRAKRPQLSSNSSSMPLLLSNSNSLEPVQMIRKCSLTA